MLLRLLRGVVSVAAAVVFCLSAVADDWPSLRGPRFDGSAAVGDVSLSSGPLQLKVVWKKPLGSGYSGDRLSGHTAA